MKSRICAVFLNRSYRIICVFLDKFPLTPNGKVDRDALPAPEKVYRADYSYRKPHGVIEKQVAEVFSEILHHDEVGMKDNFFDLGGHSLLLIKLHSRLSELFNNKLSVVDLFEYPTVEKIAQRLRNDAHQPRAFDEIHNRINRHQNRSGAYQSVAIVGMAGRYPGAQDPEILWKNICAGKEFVTHFSDAELLDEGVPADLLGNQNYVKTGVVLDDVGMFDASFFGYTPREAQVLDPQQRLFLECAWEALENSGYDPERYTGAIGVYAGISQNRYQKLIDRDPLLSGSFSDVENLISSDKDFVATRASYKFNLKGPSLTIQTACSSSLVAVHMAARSLHDFECDIVLAGGVSIKLPQKSGYLYYPEGIASPDGHCRAFDASAQGTMRGNGASVVVLKRLEDAIEDGDTIYAVIKGSAINNDGSDKVGFTAPGIEGQANVIAAAQAEAEIDPASIGYVEAHGTGTRLGDPIEISALTQAFRAGTSETGFCGVGSIKTNIGHLDAAAGCTGLIKASLALHHRMLPPSLHFKAPNPEIDFANSPFFVVDRLTPWPIEDSMVRRAGVSSFGVGGTNAHVVLEEAPQPVATSESRDWQLLVTSARTEAALAMAVERLENHLTLQPQQNLADVAYTLQVGRQAFDWRASVLCQNVGQAVQMLTSSSSTGINRSRVAASHVPVVFMFTGQGSQYPSMGAGLYESESVYRETVDACFDILQQRVGLDLKAVLYPQAGEDTTTRLRDTRYAQPALFVTEYALAQLWMSWGVIPEAMIGHSIGEYVAACVAGVVSLSDALMLVAERGRLISELEAGTMLAVAMREEDVEPLLGEALSIAAVNTPQLCVVSGPTPDVNRFEEVLRDRGVEPVRLHTSHAFHSSMMDPVLEAFATTLSKVQFQTPQRPYMSNVSGTWIHAEQVTEARYWISHLRQGVRFSAGIECLLEEDHRVFLEIGPGKTLAGLVSQHTPAGKTAGRVFNSLRPPREENNDTSYILSALGDLWRAGVTVDWKAFSSGEQRRRIPLPTYPFERQRYWVDEPSHDVAALVEKKNLNLDDWFYSPAWSRSVIPVSQQDTSSHGPYLILMDELGLGDHVARQLEEHGEKITQVQIGRSYAVLEEGEKYVLNPALQNDYESLFADLNQCNRMPLTVLHFWGIDPVNQADANELQRCQEKGFYSLLFIAQLLNGGRHPKRIEVITQGVHDCGMGETLCPEKAMVLGPCRVMTDEYPELSCRNIDLLQTNKDLQALATEILTEIDAAGGDTVVAYRDGQRLVQRFLSMPLTVAPTQPARLRQRGVYLITGGLGGIGLALAHDLAQSVNARLVITSRTQFPQREKWQQWLDENKQNDAVSQKILKLRKIESDGAEVLVLSADVADESQMRTVLQHAEDRFGPINGVIHSAGVGGGGIIQAKVQSESAAAMAAKVEGTRLLSRLLPASNLDFMVLCSSLASILGGASRVDYCAANAYLDAFASYNHRLSGTPTITINWDTWGEVGMAVETELPGEMAERRDRLVKLGMTSAEGVEAFRRALAAQPLPPQILVSTRDFNRRLPQSESPAQTETATEIAEVTEQQPQPEHRGGFARPSELSATYLAPTSETEQLVAEIWQDLLGIEQIGIDDDYFELGGHSLLAIRILGQINEAFDLNLSFQSLFDAPTVSNLSQKIDEFEYDSNEV
jgi:acyl transferase domain-containing protein/acyl carrier protein